MMEKHPLFYTRVFSVGIDDTSLNQEVLFLGGLLPKETFKEQQEEIREETVIAADTTRGFFVHAGAFCWRGNRPFPVFLTVRCAGCLLLFLNG
jgi:hypothetical protein